MARKLLIASFTDEDRILAATAKARDEGLVIYDTYTPYAVHGLDVAMGLRPTRLGIVCFLLGLGGLLSALLFQLWALAIDWPANIGGKSFTALPALVPVTFEFTVLCAAVGTALVFLLRAKLFPWSSAPPLAPGASDDRFILVIEDRGDDGAKAREVFEAESAADIREVEAPK